MSAPERVNFEPNENYNRPVEHTTGHEAVAPMTYVDQEPTDVGVPVRPDLCGTFAVYLQPDGTAGLVLAVEGEPEPRRLLLPKMIVDMVIHGKKPSLKDAMGLLGGLR